MLRRASRARQIFRSHAQLISVNIHPSPSPNHPCISANPKMQRSQVLTIMGQES